MNKSVRLFAVLAGLVLSTALGSQFAQANEGKDCSHERGEGHHHCSHWRHMRHHRLDRLAARLGLNDQQKVKIREMLKQNRQQTEAVHSKLFAEKQNLRTLVMADTADNAAIRAEAAKIAGIESDLAVQHAQMIHQMRAVLTPEQQAKLKTMQKDRENRFKNFHRFQKENWDRSHMER